MEQTLESMEQACLLMNTLTLADVDHTDENYITYIKKQKELLDEVIEHDPSLRYLRLEDSPLNLNHRFDSIPRGVSTFTLAFNILLSKMKCWEWP